MLRRRYSSLLARYRLYRTSVNRICSLFRRQAPQSEFASPTAEYKQRLKTKAIVAVEAGLDDTSDNYRRGNLGAVTLKGLGEFDNQVTVNGGQVTIHLPAGLERSLIDIPVVDIRAEPEKAALPEADRAEEPEE
jgi:hypothetical protein